MVHDDFRARDCDGGFTSPGIYYVIARIGDHHDEAYPNASCLDFSNDPGVCSFAQAQAIVISFGTANLTHIDFALARNSSISGSVRYRAPGTSVIPATSVNVTVYDGQENAIASAYTDVNGAYRLGDLVAGTYYAQTSDYYYFGQAYAGIDCPIPNQVCSSTDGTPIVMSYSPTGSTECVQTIPRRRV